MISAGALPQTPLGELTALPRPLSWIKGNLLLRGGGRGRGRGWEGRGEEGQGREGEGRRGDGEVAPPFLKFLDPPLQYVKPFS